jgi:hypothetical protein
MIIGPFQTLNTGSLCPYPCRPGAMYPFECVACNDYEYYTCTVHVLVLKKVSRESLRDICEYVGTSVQSWARNRYFVIRYCYSWLWIVCVTM